jgi:plasmid stabilization system protein ParE
MIVVLGDKIQTVDKPHGLLEAGTQQGARYMVVYKVGSDVLHIARILHGAQDWPR